MARIPVPYFTMNNGIKVPAVGIGCWMGSAADAAKAGAMTTAALKVGYRHFDTAFAYGSEQFVGKAICESGIPRSEIFVTTKLSGEYHARVQEGLDASLKALGLDYIDLYLVHWPQADDEDDNVLPPEAYPTIIDNWKQMEALLDTGKVKSIGVSNYSIKLFEQLLPHVKIVPAMNQVELHPCYPQANLLEYCKGKGILLTAYCPLGRGKDPSPFFADKTLIDIAAHYGKDATPAQVVLSWGVQRGTVVVPKSERDERIKENFQIFELSDEDMKAVDAYHEKPGMHKSLDRYTNARPGIVNGWTYAQLGWEHIGEGGHIITK